MSEAEWFLPPFSSLAKNWQELIGKVPKRINTSAPLSAALINASTK